MTQRKLRVHPDLMGSDVPEVTSYYDAISRALGDRITQAIADALERIESHPLAYREYLTGFRRIVLVPFPYLIAYAVDDDSVYAAALLHANRSLETNERILCSRA